MTRLQRLCLDAVERCGNPYLATLDVWDYIRRRRWFLSRAYMYVALAQLEDLGYLESVGVADGRRVYKRTRKVDVGETVPLAAR